MRVSLKWLAELVDVTLPLSQLCERMDMTGTKVEAVHALGASLEGVVVGQVLTKEQHPDADKLSYCTVDVGAAEPLHIVCGATNFSAGDKVPMACVGTTLPGGFAIKKAKLRGLESEGMMCSATELQIGTDASGLLVLPEDAPVGVPFAEYQGLSDSVLELEITPNRPDCLSMLGIAREIAAITATGYRIPESEVRESGTPADETVSVEIADPELCPRYTARVVRGVKIGPSPAWLAERIAAAGTRPVNNIVDVTNYVMYELGQPLHAFDMSTLAVRDGKTAITVRLTREGETVRTLDGQDRQLATDALLITDDSGPVALAGVMGGEKTEVSDATVDILLEAACFDPASISRTSRRLGLISESSLRFERGVDPDLAARASARAAALMAEVGGGIVAPGIVDVYPGQQPPLRLSLRTGRVNQILGTDLETAEVAALLGPLGIITSPSDGGLECVVPTYRPDITREIDLIEEVARLFGLENIPATRPGGRERIGALTDAQRFRIRFASALRAAGLDEHIGYSFGDPGDIQRMGWELAPDQVLVELVNPMSEEQAVLRWTLVPGLLRAVSHNQRRGMRDVHLFEMGTVFMTSPGRKQPKERLMVGGAMAGAWGPAAWNESPSPLDFFDMKGVLAGAFEVLGTPEWTVRPAERPWLQSGRTAEIVIAGDVVGWIGEAAAVTLDAFEAVGTVVLFELSFPAVLKASISVAPRYAEIPRYPAYELDVALVVDEAMSAERLTAAIRSAGGPLLESVRLFDVYRDPADAPEGSRRLAVGKKSMAYSLSYRSADKTLSEAEVRPAYDKLVRKLAGSLGAEVRS